MSMFTPAVGMVVVDFQKWEHQTEGGDMHLCRLDGNALDIQWRETRTDTCLSNFPNAKDSTQVNRLEDDVWNRKVGLPACCNPRLK